MADRYEVPGSERTPLPNAKILGDCDPGEEFLVTVVVRAQKGLGPPSASGALSREAYARAYGASAQDLAAVEGFARQSGLSVVESSAARRSVILRGTAAQFCKAFDVTLKMYQSGDTTYRGRTGRLSVPGVLQNVVVAVLGLDNRPQASTRFRIRENSNSAASAADTSFSPIQVAKLYDFPTGVDGTGECIGIIELGGGFDQSDLSTYFQSLELENSVG